jgi:L-fucose mutarotase/ribose pyranase (RbsD/FucU family)
MSKRLIAIPAMLLLFVGVMPLHAGNTANWKEILAERLPLYGHRNWIVVTDSAYPAQSSSGIETVVSDANAMEVLRTVLSAIQSAKHVRPIIYTDRELRFVNEQDAPGIEKYRNELASLLGKEEMHSLPHEEIISKLDEASREFKVLIIKTNLTIPYTSVFFQLNCGYWSDAAERKLRATMAEQAGK